MFAAREGVVAGTLSWWGNRLKAEVPRRADAKGQAFARLRVTASSVEAGRVEVVTPSGVVVRVFGAVGEVELLAVLRAVRQC